MPPNIKKKINLFNCIRTANDGKNSFLILSNKIIKEAQIKHNGEYLSTQA